MVPESVLANKLLIVLDVEIRLAIVPVVAVKTLSVNELP